ncbi:amidohydrolase family protein [Candidatus Bipolaricaulota bacterium]
MGEREALKVDTLVVNGITITMDTNRTIYDPGFIAITKGKIVATGSASSCPYEAAETIDASGMVILPGLINGHTHLDQAARRGCFDDDPTSTRNERLSVSLGLTESRARRAAALGLLEQLHYGITTVQENHWVHYHIHSTDGICDAIQDSGMRAVVSRGINDVEEYTPAAFCEDAGEVLKDLDRLEEKYDSDYIQITSEPCTILRCKPETILAMVDWAKQRNKTWIIHMAHDQKELADALETVGMGCVQYAEQLGVLSPDMLGIHCAALLDEEVDLLGKHGIRISHCPECVIKGGGQVPPIWELEKLGATVAIGTDGTSSNTGQNLWASMKNAVYMQRVRFADGYLGSAEQALEMVTIKGAEVLLMEDRIGSIEAGKEADIALFKTDQLHLAPGAMLVSNLVYSGCNIRADTVLIGGNVVLRAGKSTTLDEERILAQARETQAELVGEAGLKEVIGLARSWPVVASSQADPASAC